MKSFITICTLAFLLLSTLSADDRPNIIVILADDAGFADFGAFGGIADTPEIDRLATEGMRFTRAFSNARCMPTRLSLLTGLPPQLADFKLFTEIKGNSVTLAEVLRESGYATYMVGKWHLGWGDSKTTPTPIPSERGFDRFYGIWDGAAWPRKQSLTEPERGNGSVRIIEDGVPIPWENVPEDYYVTFTWNNKAIEMINSTPEDQPFFLYLSHTAPHWPIQPFQSYVDGYEGRFDVGWEAIREQILANQKALGILPPEQTLAPLANFYSATPYASADTNLINSYRTSSAEYYATITELDDSIGWLMDALETNGRADNTLIIFLSDNGADAVIGKTERGMVSNTPFHGHKLSYFEGGIATPFIAWWPGRIPANTINTSHEIHLEDFMPTVLELTGAVYPEVYNGYSIFPHQGRSFLPALLDPNHNGGPRPWFWEHDAQRGVWDAPWKAVFADRRHPVPVVDYAPEANGWRLYNLETDRTEDTPLAEYTDFVQPGATPTEDEQRLLDMIQSWKDWATSVGWEPTGRTVEDNPLDNGFRGTDGTTERASPESYERFFPLPGDQSNNRLIQTFAFDAPVSGLRQLAFEAVNPSNAPMSVSIYGSTAYPDIPADADDDPLNMPDNAAIPSLGTLLSTYDFGGSMFDWSSFTHGFDTGTTGYTHLTLIFELGDVNQSVDSTQILPASYSDWVSLNFPPAEQENPAISGETAVAPAGDTTNFEKFVTGRNADESGGMSVTGKIVANGFDISFDVLPGILSRANVLWDRSSDLSQWDPVVPAWFGISGTGADGRDRFHARFPLTGASAEFFQAVPVSTDSDGGDTGSRMAIVNGSFDAPFVTGSGWARNSQHVNAGWVAHSSGSKWNLDAVEGNASADNTGAANLLQILLDNNLTQGEVTLRFDAVNTVANDLLEVYVYGVEENFWINLFDTGGPKIDGDSVTPAAHTALVNGQSFGLIPTLTQQEITFTVPAGGFFYYAIMVRTQGVVSPAIQKIDNFELE